MIFKSRYSWFTIVLWSIIYAFLVVMLVLSIQEYTTEAWVASGMLLLLLLTLLSFTLVLRYTIKGNVLEVQLGFITTRIPIMAVTSVRYHKGIFVPVIYKPAAHTEGLIIVYGYNDIYISPEKMPTFVAELCRINPSISLKNFPN